MKTTLTVGNVKTLIDNSVVEPSTITAETAKTIVSGVNQQIQLRDYLMGLPKDNPAENVIDFLNVLINYSSPKDLYAVNTVMATFMFEAGLKDEASIILDLVDYSYPNYSLAKLIRRVISADWPSSSFATMRNELHDKVIFTLREIQDEEVITNG